MSQGIMEDDDDFFDMMPSNSKIVNIETLRSERNVEVGTEGDLFTEKMYTEDMWDSKAFNSLIKNTESQARTSDDYKVYVGYLKEEIGLRRCAVLGQINDSMAEIEFHHYPFTLYDIVYIVASAKIARGEKVSSFILTHEVLQLHFDNMVGVTPLCKTVHELVHAGELFVSLKSVFGEVSSFVEMYRDGISDDLIDKYNKLVEFTEMNVQVDASGILEKGKKNWNLQKIEALDYQDL